MERIKAVFEIRDGGEGVGDVCRVGFVVLCFLLAVWVGFLWGARHMEGIWKATAIERGFAEYDSKTAVFQWKEQPKHE